MANCLDDSAGEVCFNAVIFSRLFSLIFFFFPVRGCSCPAYGAKAPVSPSEGICVLQVQVHVSVLAHFWRRCGTPPPQSIVHPDQLRNAWQPVVQEGETRDVHLTTCPNTTPSQGILWVTSDFFLCQELALPGRDAQAVAFYLSRRMYLPLRSRLLLKWMENQRNEVRIIP